MSRNLAIVRRPQACRLPLLRSLGVQATTWAGLYLTSQFGMHHRESTPAVTTTSSAQSSDSSAPERLLDQPLPISSQFFTLRDPPR
eukprot:1355858-Rhodomonas_salina.1